MAKIIIRVGAALDANATRVYEPLEKAAERARKNIEKSFTTAAKEPARVERAAKSSGDRLIEEVEREADRIIREEEKAQSKRTSEVQKGTRERIRLEQQAAREVERTLEQENSRVARAQRMPRDEMGRFQASERRRLSRGVVRVLHGVARGAGMIAGGAEDFLRGVGVQTTLAEHEANAVDIKQRAQAISSAGYIPGAAGAQGMLQDPDKLLKEIQQTGDYAAISGNEIAEGLQKFVGLTGDLATGRETLKDIAKLAKATNSDFVEMSTAAGEVSNHLGNVPHKAETVSAGMRVIAGQGKMGALEIRDFARQMAKIAANAPAFEGGIDKTIGELGLIAQEAKMGGGAASAPQAATSVAAFARDFSKKTTFKHWAAAGLNPFTDNKHTQLRSPEELVLAAIRYSKGDQLKLAQLFPNSMAMRAVKPFANIYNEAAGTHEDKLKAVNDEFERMRKAQLDTAEVSRAFGAAMAQDKSAVQLANNRLDEMAVTLTTALLPAVAALAPAIEALTPAITDAIGWFGKILGINPNEDADARKKRKDEDARNAMQLELQNAENQKERLTKGEHGAEIHVGEIDKAHEDQQKQHAKDVAADIAKREQIHAAHVAEFKRTGQVQDFADWNLGIISGHTKKTEENKLIAEERELNASKIDLNQTNTILSDIRTALATGRAQYAPTPAPVPPPTTQPAEGD